MRNDTLRDLSDAYPQTLAAAFRIAQGWTGKKFLQKDGGQTLSAFATDETKPSSTFSTSKSSKPWVRGGWC